MRWVDERLGWRTAVGWLRCEMGERPFAFLSTKYRDRLSAAWVLRDWGENGRWFGCDKGWENGRL
ncbi:MAG: hypothetical protein M5U34_27070 [Chloroflexi bacterium]|nr:hypothetical protein [Chloroflexota bacterium]